MKIWQKGCFSTGYEDVKLDMQEKPKKINKNLKKAVDKVCGVRYTTKARQERERPEKPKGLKV